MSQYTTGELAKMCDVSVRTVQYYDSRNILTPSALSEGGRRLYNDDDAKKLKIICFLRDAGFSINNISQFLEEENTEKVISILVSRQKEVLAEEMKENRKKFEMLERIEKELKIVPKFSVESIGDIAYQMKHLKNLRKARGYLIIAGIIMDMIEWSTFLLGIFKGIWLPFIIGLPLTLALGVLVFLMYIKKIAYICPECHAVFKPKSVECFFAYHNVSGRKLTCPICKVKSFCVETCRDDGGK